MKNAIRSFIDRHGLAAAAIDAEKLLADFTSEMSAGLAGAASSLAMIPSYISLGRPVPVGKPVIVLDAGGTNLRICVVAFDAAGHRLGRGRGYYDRFLTGCPSIYKIGVCFPFQRVAEVPAEAHDVCMDEII